SDGTPVANFWYDSGSACFAGWCLWNQLANTKGRLSATCTSNAPATCSGGNSGTVYSYDSMGRILNYWQATPYNEGSSAWQMTYNYDLAGDVTSWTHPAGFAITNSINAAQQITQIQSSLVDSTHSQYLAQNITYTPWGAEQTLENGCAGSGCTNIVETYAYNNRLQPAMIELGTPSNASADYCFVYNYYSSLGNATSCAAPSQGAGDNGNVMGYLYQNVNPSFSHTAAYQYDSLNRLGSAVAAGSLTYNLAYYYDQYGNMTCTVNGQTNGLCPAYGFNPANNRITNSGYTYDAAGDLTADGTHTYQWDAEGRFASEDGGATEVRTYNALGERARIVSQGTPLDLFSDPAGKPLGLSGSYSLMWPLPGHAGDIYYQGYDAEFFHANGLGSTVMESNAAGTISEHLMFYPWGQLWAVAGGGGYNFASIPYRDVVSNLDLARFRDYSFGQGRWLSPDPLGGDITNPQSLNRYAYALNNPTTLTDPSGLGPCTIDGQPGFCTTSTDVGPGDPMLEMIWQMDSCLEWDNCDGLTSGPDSGGGGAVSPPKPAPPKPNIITWPQLQKLVHQNNESNFCDDLIDCIVFKESTAPGGFNANAVPPVNPSTGVPVSSATGLMQITRGAAATDNNNYPHAPSGAALYNALSNPALNIFVGSEYLQILSDVYGGLRSGLNHYGGTVTSGSYANDVLNCVEQLQQGNFYAAEGAAHGHP
ncbi:MAG: RHS repeat-associated core domain-containing protein, partial [Terriglobia bacterium]